MKMYQTAAGEMGKSGGLFTGTRMRCEEDVRMRTEKTQLRSIDKYSQLSPWMNMTAAKATAMAAAPGDPVNPKRGPTWSSIRETENEGEMQEMRCHRHRHRHRLSRYIAHIAAFTRTVGDDEVEEVVLEDPGRHGHVP